MCMKTFENRLIFREAIDISRVSCFLTNSVDIVPSRVSKAKLFRDNF